MALRRYGIVALLILSGIAAIALTYPRLSQTADENFHVQAGLQWWEKGQYTLHRMNPPLARIAAASLVHLLPPREIAQLGLSDVERYNLRTMFTRLGILPFYILSCFVVWAWGRHLFGAQAALWSLAVYVTLPPVLAHAGLATTDMPYAAMLLCALYALTRWLESPSWPRALCLGVAAGLAVTCKYSALLHFPVAALLILLFNAALYDMRSSPRRLLTMAHATTWLACAMPACVVAIGLVMRFSYDDIHYGILDLVQFNQIGFSIWFYGPPADYRGVWYFFPVVYFFKTPLAFHLLSLMAVVLLIRRFSPDDDMQAQRFFPLLAAVAVLLSSMLGHVNMGVRHILVIYPLLAVMAGYALHMTWRAKPPCRLVAVALLLWQVVACARSYPEYIAYYNEAAGGHPERIALDSDFDWGQNIRLLDEQVRQRGIASLHLCIRRLRTTPNVLAKHLSVPDNGCPDAPVTGWVAVARNFAMMHPQQVAWLRSHRPVAPVGLTMDLYYIKE